MAKLPGVESVAVTLNDGRAVLTLKPENTLTLEQVRERVGRNGFTPRDAQITAVAEVVGGVALRLRITGTLDVFDVRTTPELEQQLRAAVPRLVIVEGTIPARKDPEDHVVLQVSSVKPVPRQGTPRVIGPVEAGPRPAGLEGVRAPAMRRTRRGRSGSAGTAPRQIRWKFFSISRRVMRSTTGRPCGQTLEYAVRRSSWSR
jgi:hypothetical protein